MADTLHTIDSFLKRKKVIESQLNAANAFIDSARPKVLVKNGRPSTLIRTAQGSLEVPAKLRAQMMNLALSLKDFYLDVETDMKRIDKSMNKLSSEAANMFDNHIK